MDRPWTLLPAALTAPGSWAISDGRVRRTFAELERRSRQVAAALSALGIGGDRRLAVLMRNRAEWAELFFGNLLAGSEFVPLNWHLTAGEAAHIVTDSGSVVVIHDDANAELAAAIGAATGVQLLRVEGDWETMVAGQPAVIPPLDRAAGSVLPYTGGTTGRPRAVVRQNLRQIPLRDVGGFYVRWASIWRLPTDGAHTHLTVCPLYHSAPAGFVVWSLMLGHRIVIEDRFEPERTLELIERERVTTLNLVPTQIVRLLRLPEEIRSHYDTSSLQSVWHGAAPCPRWAKEQLIDWFGLVVWEYFASTEGTGPFLCDPMSYLERPGTIGQPPAHLTPVVLDEQGHPARPGQIGELWFHSEWGPPAYLNDEDTTRSIRRPNGLFTAGDFGWIDDDGYVFIADRRVDLILSGGVNIYPAEIEAAITEHPAVSDAAVIGRPDDEWGQTVHAVVELVPGTALQPDELDAFVRQRLAGFKCPKSYRFVDALPRDEAGKLRRHQLRGLEAGA